MHSECFYLSPKLSPIIKFLGGTLIVTIRILRGLRKRKRILKREKLLAVLLSSAIAFPRIKKRLYALRENKRVEKREKLLAVLQQSAVCYVRIRKKLAFVRKKKTSDLERKIRNHALLKHWCRFALFVKPFKRYVRKVRQRLFKRKKAAEKAEREKALNESGQSTLDGSSMLSSIPGGERAVGAIPGGGGLLTPEVQVLVNPNDPSLSPETKKIALQKQMENLSKQMQELGMASAPPAGNAEGIQGMNMQQFLDSQVCQNVTATPFGNPPLGMGTLEQLQSPMKSKRIVPSSFIVRDEEPPKWATPQVLDDRLANVSDDSFLEATGKPRDAARVSLGGKGRNMRRSWEPENEAFIEGSQSTDGGMRASSSRSNKNGPLNISPINASSSTHDDEDCSSSCDGGTHVEAGGFGEKVNFSFYVEDPGPNSAERGSKTLLSQEAVSALNGLKKPNNSRSRDSSYNSSGSHSHAGGMDEDSDDFRRSIMRERNADVFIHKERITSMHSSICSGMSGTGAGDSPVVFVDSRHSDIVGLSRSHASQGGVQNNTSKASGASRVSTGGTAYGRQTHHSHQDPHNLSRRTNQSRNQSRVQTHQSDEKVEQLRDAPQCADAEQRRDRFMSSTISSIQEEHSQFPGINESTAERARRYSKENSLHIAAKHLSGGLCDASRIPSGESRGHTFNLEGTPPRGGNRQSNTSTGSWVLDREGGIPDDSRSYGPGNAYERSSLNKSARSGAAKKGPKNFARSNTTDVNFEMRREPLHNSEAEGTHASPQFDPCRRSVTPADILGRGRLQAVYNRVDGAEQFLAEYTDNHFAPPARTSANAETRQSVQALLNSFPHSQEESRIFSERGDTFHVTDEDFAASPADSCSASANGSHHSGGGHDINGRRHHHQDGVAHGNRHPHRHHPTGHHDDRKRSRKTVAYAGHPSRTTAEEISSSRSPLECHRSSNSYSKSPNNEGHGSRPHATPNNGGHGSFVFQPITGDNISMNKKRRGPAVSRHSVAMGQIRRMGSDRSLHSGHSCDREGCSHLLDEGESIIPLRNGGMYDVGGGHSRSPRHPHGSPPPPEGNLHYVEALGWVQRVTPTTSTGGGNTTPVPRAPTPRGIHHRHHHHHGRHLQAPEMPPPYRGSVVSPRGGGRDLYGDRRSPRYNDESSSYTGHHRHSVGAAAMSPRYGHNQANKHRRHTTVMPGNTRGDFSPRYDEGAQCDDPRCDQYHSPPPHRNQGGRSKSTYYPREVQRSGYGGAWGTSDEHRNPHRHKSARQHRHSIAGGGHMVI